MGNTNHDNTLPYIQIEQAIFSVNSHDRCTVKTTNNNETKETFSAGFDYICQKDDLLYFRKQK